MDKNAQQYAESFLQAIDTILEQRKNSVSFDRTLVCEVVNVYSDNASKFLVSTGGLKFNAYAQAGGEYHKGDQVYVLIPDGDYSKNKIIIGKYGVEEDLPKSLYTNPFNNLITNKKIEIITDTKPMIKVNDQESSSIIKTGIKLKKSGLSEYNYIGLDCSFITQNLETVTSGRYYVSIDFLEGNNSLLPTEQLKAMLTLTSDQLYGNPYQLTNNLHFQHLFNFPLEYQGTKFDEKDILKATSIKITLGSFQDFDESSVNESSTITLNSADLYFGFDIENTLINSDKVVLSTDNALEYPESDTSKTITVRLEWRDLGTNKIYNQDQPYENDEYNIYWLQYSESIGYQKTLEDDGGIDIEESGTYWKTVMKEAVNDPDAYTYTFFPSNDWKKEQIKVIIKNKNTGAYIESNGLSFTNKNFTSEVGSNLGSKDTLKLTLAPGDDGIYNNYGIDNNLLNTYNQEHTLTVDYVDLTEWEKTLQTVVWKIPSKATMIQIVGEGWKEEDGFYTLTFPQQDNDTAEGNSISFKLSSIFSYNKTNNTIYCYVTRYKDTEKTIITDTYQGSITLQFGIQGNSGTNWAFNITSDIRSINDANLKMILTASLEDSMGNPIPDTAWKDKVEWKWFQTIGEENGGYTLKQDADDKSKATITKSKGKNDWYAIVQASISWQATSGIVDLIAYLPIATGDPGLYLTGASRVIYNSQGTTPNYDKSKYWLSSDTDNSFTYQIITSVEGRQVFEISAKEQNLKPLSLIPTTPAPMAVAVENSEDVIIYSQPILVLRNQYQSQLLNEWNGQLITDEGNNFILSALMGAGVKHSNNTFTGVLLGAVGTEIASAKTGIYGMAQGELRYKLDEDGNFYVGSGGNNRIDFNNGNLNIEAQKFTLTTNKLTIDSNSGIKLKNSNSDTVIELTTAGTAKFGGWNITNNALQYLNGTTLKCFLSGTGSQSSNYAVGSYSARKDWTIWSNGNFGVTKDGVLYASGARISGTIILEDGSQTKDGKIIATTEYTDNKIASQISEDMGDVVKRVTKCEQTIDGFETEVSQLRDDGFNLSSTIEQQAGLISNKVGITSNGTIINGTGWSLTSDAWIINSYKNKTKTEVLKVNKDGLTVTGTIKADDGNVAGWNIEENYFGSYSGEKGYTDYFLSSSGITHARKLDSFDSRNWFIYWKDKFGVTTDGTLYANGAVIDGNATFTGKIKAGTIMGDKGNTKFTDFGSNTEGRDVYGSSWATTNGKSKIVIGTMDSSSPYIWLDAGLASTTMAYGNFIFHGDNFYFQEGTVYTDSGTVSQSDKNEKNTISTLDNSYSVLFDNLRPVTYKYNDGTSDRLHTGFIAQEVAEALQKANIDTQDFAGLVIQNKGTENEKWGLRYEEFIALNTSEIQKLKARVAELENEIKEIKQNEI